VAGGETEDMGHRFRKNNAARYNAISLARQKIFRDKTHGCCFNSLTADHRVSYCHDPMRCWRYKGCGHTPTNCPGKCKTSLLSKSSQRSQPLGTSGLLAMNASHHLTISSLSQRLPWIALFIVVPSALLLMLLLTVKLQR
jgi:hypothetical protein